MALTRRGLLLAAAVVACTLRGGAAQMQMSGEEDEMLEEMGVRGSPMGRKNQEPMAEPIKSDLRHIYCGVCRKMVEVAHGKAVELLGKRFRYQKKRQRETVEFDGEAAIQDYTETMCNPLKPEGEWVGRIDLVQEGEKLLLATQPVAGRCLRECRTVEAACNEVLDRADTDFTEVLYTSVQAGSELEQAQRYICHRAAGVCKKKPPPLTAPRAFDERFTPLSAEEKQMQDMQSNLKESGMSGTMYRREDLAGMMDKMKDLMPEGEGEDELRGGVEPAMDEDGELFDTQSGLPIVEAVKEEL